MSNEFKNQYVYITKWTNELEKYVLLDEATGRFLKVIVAKAQIFNNHAEAETFAVRVQKAGNDKPEVIKVIDTPNAIYDQKIFRSRSYL